MPRHRDQIRDFPGKRWVNLAQRAIHLVGLLNKQIAYELDVSMTTIKAHVSAILQKMNVFSRTQAVIMANKIGFKP